MKDTRIQYFVSVQVKNKIKTVGDIMSDEILKFNKENNINSRYRIIKK